MPNITTFEILEHEIKKVGGKPVILEALWDGDTGGWFLCLYLYTKTGYFFNRKMTRYELGFIRLGGMDDSVAFLAKEFGQKAIAKYDLEFYFPSPKHPDDDCPTWTDRHLAIKCADCNKLIIPSKSPYLPKDICYRCHLTREENKKIRKAISNDAEVKNFNKEQESQSAGLLTENQILDILSKSISNLGYWSWWATDLPALVQVEFGRTLLYFPPTDKAQAPNSQIAIQFINPKSISFLSRQELHNNWFEDLQNDKITPPTCSREYFTFTNIKLQTEIINNAKNVKTIHGYSPKEKVFLTENYKLVFWAEDYGFAVSAEDIKLVSKTGKIELEEIPKLNSAWWAYWKRYYEVINTEDALPKDYTCEVTIPMKNN